MAGLTIGFAGLSHLGIVSGCAAAEKGFRVVGYDDDAAVVEALARGTLSVVEPNLPETFLRNRDRLSFTSEPSGLADCDLVYIARDVPTDDHGISDVSAITDLIDRVQPHIRENAVIVILCQVPPGFTRKLSDTDPRFYYQVETLIFGRAVERALRPERLIIGAADARAELPKPFNTVLSAFDCPVLTMRLESAELAKISINMCLVASIGVTNTMAGVCEVVGADWSEIVPALRLDARIGPSAYLKPGLGLTGGNLERDLATVINLADAHDRDHGIVDAWIANSAIRKDWAYETLSALMLDSNPAARIAVLGLAYKENTHSVKNSASLRLLSRLSGCDTVVYDPVVDGAKVAPESVVATSAMDAVADADVVVLITPWPEFSTLKSSIIAAAMRGRVMIDPHALIDGTEAVAAGFVYATLGCGTVAPKENRNA